MSKTHFPYDIYTKEVEPLPYFRRDVISESSHFETTDLKHNRNYNRDPSLNVNNGYARWGWGDFPNGYGVGNFMLIQNTPGEVREPQGYVSAKTQYTIDYYKRNIVTRK
jgi:hypothetical protein